MTAPERLARLNDYIDQWAKIRPGHPAMVQHEDDKTITYKKFAELIDFFALVMTGCCPVRVARSLTEASSRPFSVVASPTPLRLPDSTDVEGWLKAKVTEIKGADRNRPLYHFELWLEPPAAMKRRLVGVAYDFSTPAIRPQSQASSDRTSGFRVSAGGLACADEIEMTLRFDNGSVHKVVVDGCKLLS